MIIERLCKKLEQEKCSSRCYDHVESVKDARCQVSVLSNKPHQFTELCVEELIGNKY